ncbi:MAG TPA: hypothetical protein VLH39_00450 [Magnetospirillaceae bacterium]|nr:hypothetical protein [Magnetospirillaceae bacterium]
MKDLDERPSRLLYAVIALAFLLYYLVAAVPLREELALHPAWALDVARAREDPAVLGYGRSIPFRLGERYGMFTSEGGLLWSRAAGFDAAVSEALVLPYAPDSTSLEALDSAGRPAFRIEAEGWPFFRSGRLFLVSPEMDSVAEYSREGKLLWSYDFHFNLTDFDAAGDLAVGGLLDGTLEGIDSDGRRVFQFAPGGSRVGVILGVAIDPSSEAVAAIAGIDRQRFILLVRKGGVFRVQHHEFLNSDYREQVTVRFTRDGRYVLYRQPEGIAVFDRETGRTSMLPVKAESFELASYEARGLEFLFARNAGSDLIVCFRPPSGVIFTFPLPGDFRWMKFQDGSLFLGSGTVVGRIDVVEE